MCRSSGRIGLSGLAAVSLIALAWSCAGLSRANPSEKASIGEGLIARLDRLEAELKAMKIAVAQKETRLGVAEILFPVGYTPSHPSHKFWPLTRNPPGNEAAGWTIGTPIAVAAHNEADVDKFVTAASQSSGLFPADIVAAWITPVAQLQEMFHHPDASLARLEARVVGKNKVVVVSTAVTSPGKPIPFDVLCKLYVIYKHGDDGGERPGR